MFPYEHNRGIELHFREVKETFESGKRKNINVATHGFWRTIGKYTFHYLRRSAKAVPIAIHYYPFQIYEDLINLLRA